MSKTGVKLARKISAKQLEVLSLLFKFRFGTSQQIAEYFGKSNRASVQQRLGSLTNNGLIAKRYDKSYRLQGRGAEYYLLPRGAQLLREQQAGKTTIAFHIIRNLYKGDRISDAFIAHKISVFAFYLQLKALYGEGLEFTTKSSLDAEQYDLFPQPFPDAFITLTSGARGKKKYFFLDLFEDTVPFFVVIRRIKKYLSYAEDGQWDGELPAILMVSESARRQTQTQRRIAKELRESYEDEVVFATTTKETLLASLPSADKVWRVVDEDKTESSLSSI